MIWRAWFQMSMGKIIPQALFIDPDFVDTAGVDLKAVEAANDAYQIIIPDSNTLSSLAEKFLSEKTQLKKSSFLRKEKNIKQFIN